MKLLSQLICLSLLSLLASCGDDNSFRAQDVLAGASAVEVDESLEEEVPSENEEKVNKYAKKCADIEGQSISDEDYMTILDYDASKLDDFLCDDGKVIFCHVPPGNASAAHYISIGSSDAAIDSHLNKIAEEGGSPVYSYILKCEKYGGKKKTDDDYEEEEEGDYEEN